ncbi:hypothetical protein N7466_003175 [Penicillium verhagenii]|uniref:uncharacterized protein n=1 Tax=Penicillium verhagenii TaxID=1562060 RepID=UPI0025454551|nr:uncharacterized protein N7466_003175 [Penicillium verhagenii]KAJ5936725.1 hypothetical protein N7466_003175 [Penicillium verhagenii]
MDTLLSSKTQLDALVLKPELQPLLSLIKGARNGIVYGSKVRFPHALVYVTPELLDRADTMEAPKTNICMYDQHDIFVPIRVVKLVFNATRQHARNLSTFAIIYKLSMILLRNINPSGSGKEGRYDSFFSGLLGGYAVFGRQRGSISQQIVIYVFARVMLSLAKIAVQPNMHPLSPLLTPESRAKIYDHAWPAFASFTWAFVMYIFRWYPETLASSLRSSMLFGLRSLGLIANPVHPQ